VVSGIRPVEGGAPAEGECLQERPPCDASLGERVRAVDGERHVGQPRAGRDLERQVHSQPFRQPAPLGGDAMEPARDASWRVADGRGRGRFVLAGIGRLQKMGAPLTLAATDGKGAVSMWISP